MSTPSRVCEQKDVAGETFLAPAWLQIDALAPSAGPEAVWPWSPSLFPLPMANLCLVAPILELISVSERQ